MTRRARLGLLLVLLGATAATAESSLQFDVQSDGGAAGVWGGGRLLLRVRHAEPATAAALARDVARRLASLAAAGTGPDAFQVTADGDGRSLDAAGFHVVTITTEAARLSGLTPESLATTWLHALQQVFAGPYLSVAESETLVPLAGRAVVKVCGQPAGARLTATAADPTVAGVGLNGRNVTVTGLALGHTRLTLALASASLELPVQVRQPAGRLDRPVRAVVTGREPAPAMVRQAVTAELAAAATLAPGAAVHLDPTVTLSLGHQRVPVVLDGPELLPVRLTAAVELAVEPWPDGPADWLLVSNDPETVRQPRLLLRGRLARDQRTRLLYHHQNGTASPLAVEVRVVNPGDQPAAVHVRDAVAGPSPSPEYAGHMAARRYWDQRRLGQGWRLTLPPHSAWTMTAVGCQPKDNVSGLSELTPLAGDGLEVQVVATADPPTLGRRAVLDPCAAPFQDMFRFAQPDRRVQASYQPGGYYAFVSIGRDPLKSVAGPPLLGNYGAVYDVDLEFRNPTDAEQHFELVFSADGGPALGTFLVDGRPAETKFVRGGQQERLLDLTLPPGGSRKIAVRTLPESGSNYPLRLVGRPYTRGWAGRGTP